LGAPRIFSKRGGEVSVRALQLERDLSSSLTINHIKSDMSTNAEIDIDEVVESGAAHIPGTQANYNTYLNKLKVCVAIAVKGGPYTAQLLQEHLSDVNIASFLHIIGRDFGYKPHVLKAASAALGSVLLKLEMPGLYHSRANYPKSHKMIKVRQSHSAL
jgi:hypothetical protein